VWGADHHRRRDRWGLGVRGQHVGLDRLDSQRDHVERDDFEWDDELGLRR
jgi:hypothetical protein